MKTKEYVWEVDESARGFFATVRYELNEEFAGKRVKVTIEELPPEKSLGEIALGAYQKALFGSLGAREAEPYESPGDWDKVAEAVVAEYRRRNP